ncbi:MAG: 2-isopropylmalate synthase [Oscillospiraceae bacterium]|nr:2-isopropylmalate synthase [Oscillospiraceae bacterium]
MAITDNKTNLLELDPYDFTLQDVEEPNLFRNIFPYDMVPVIPFNHRRVPINMPDEIWISDTTFRDGQQSMPPYTVEQIVKLFKLLSKLGGKNGIIRQTEFFAYSKKDVAAIEKCMEEGLEFPEITTWIRAKKEDYELVRNIGVKETGVLMSCSDYHIFKKLHMTRKQALEHYIGIARDIIDTGLRPRCHLEDITRADFYGFVVPLTNALQDISRETGVPVKIRACDTMGYGIPHSGVALPRSVPGVVYGLQHYSKMPSQLLEWHGHNDFYKGVANASAAWLYGASSVNCSLLGIGERTGNVPLEAMVFEYAGFKGSFDGMEPCAITEIAEIFESDIGYKIPHNTPFVGKNFNVTRAGIHADGLMKDQEIYNIFDTEKFLGRPPLVSVSNTSGIAGIAYWINTYYKLSGSKKLEKNHPTVKKIKEWSDAEYASGRESIISDHELIALVEEYGLE